MHHCVYSKSTVLPGAAAFGASAVGFSTNSIQSIENNTPVVRYPLVERALLAPLRISISKAVKTRS